MGRKGLVIVGFLAGCASTVAGVEQNSPKRCEFVQMEPLICNRQMNPRVYGRFELGSEISLGTEYVKIDRESGRFRLRVFDQNCNQREERAVNFGERVGINREEPTRTITFIIQNQGPIQGIDQNEIVVLAFTSVEGVCGRNCSNESWIRINSDEETRINNPTASFRIIKTDQRFEVYPQSYGRQFIGPHFITLNGGVADYQNFGLEIERRNDGYFARINLCNVF